MRSTAPVGRVAAVVASALLTLSFLAFGVPSSRASVTVSASGFLERIERARILAETGEREPRPAIMDSVRDALGLPATLTMSDATLELRSDEFLDALRGDDATDFSLAIQRLDVIASEVGEAAREPSIDQSDRGGGTLAGLRRGGLRFRARRGWYVRVGPRRLPPSGMYK